MKPTSNAESFFTCTRKSIESPSTSASCISEMAYTNSPSSFITLCRMNTGITVAPGLLPGPPANVRIDSSQRETANVSEGRMKKLPDRRNTPPKNIRPNRWMELEQHKGIERTWSGDRSSRIVYRESDYRNYGNTFWGNGKVLSRRNLKAIAAHKLENK